MFNSGQGQQVPLFSKMPSLLHAPTRLTFNGYQGMFQGGKLAGA
jgi:hypothetical protein